MKLRYYQEEAVNCVNTDKFNGILVLPTGSGKSHIISGLAKKFQSKPILILQPSKEILEQNYDKLLKCADGPEEIGIFSASLNQKEIKRITFATIGSIKNYESFYHFKNIIIDECHYVSPEKMTMYEKLIRYNFPKILVGLTATPYRMHTNLIGSSSWKFLHRLTPKIFDDIAYIYQNKQAFEDGYILKPTYHEYSYDTRTLIKKGNDYTDESILRLNKVLGLHDKIVSIVLNSYGKKHFLIFVKSIQEVEIITDKLRFYNINCSEVSSKTPKKNRNKILNSFRSGELKAVINVGICTTGFDFPELDCVIGARPTMSLGLYYQMIGRGVRPHKDKTGWDYHDLCGNVNIFGKVEDYVIEGKGENTSLRCENKYLIKGRDIATQTDGAGEWILPFGRFRGRRIRDVETWYLVHCVKNFQNFRAKKQFELELARRNELS